MPCWSGRSLPSRCRRGRGGDGVGAGGGFRLGGDRGDPIGADRRGGGGERRRRPAAGGAKVKTPPATGSTGLLAATVTASGLANAVPVAVDCGVLPATGVSVNPWLWKAPMSGLGESSGSPRWSVVIGWWCRVVGDARADGGAAGEQGHGLGRPAVVAQRGQEGIGHADDVAVDPIDQPPRAARADQVVAARDVAKPPMSLAPEELVLPATMVSVRVAGPTGEL